jgi:hypothetical protein
LTVVFCVSGIALNHVHQWNPNYTLSRVSSPVKSELQTDQEIIDYVQTEHKDAGKLKGSFWVSPNEFKLFYHNGLTVFYFPEKKSLTVEKITPRPILKAFNGLHVNEAKKLWTFVSDLYAVALLYLALSALFMVKGKYGMKGRGGYLTAIGIIIPLFFIFFYS